MKRVLLTCARIPTTLYLARALHKAGAEVHVADPFRIHLCKASNSVYACHKTVSPVDNADKYKQEILDIITKNKIDLVIPIFEEGIFLSKFYNDIASKCTITLSNFDLLLQLHNKFDFINLANSLGLPVPKTYKYDGSRDNFEFTKNTKFIIKKIFSRAGNGFEIFEPGQNPNVQPNGEYIIQEFVPGRLACTCSYVHNGKLLLHLAYKQLILTPNDTAAVCFQAIDDKDIQESIKSFVSKIKYNGWISFDIMRKPDGSFVYIECNPRPSIGVYLFNKKILSQTLLEATSDTNFQDAADVGAKAQMVLVSMECIMRKLLKGKPQFKEIKNLLSAKDLTFDISDLYPFIYQFACYIYVKYKAIKLKTSFLYAATQDLEWN